MKKHLFLTSAIAISAVFGGANADTTTLKQVTFAGDYELTNGDIANAGTDLKGSSYNYTYVKSDGTSSASTPYTTAPAYADFTYTDKAGTTDVALTADTLNLTEESFSGKTTADGTAVKTTQKIAAGQKISRENYTYVNGANKEVQLGESAQTFSEDVALNSTYANGKSVTVSSDTTEAPILSGSNYVYKDETSGETFHLNADGTKMVDSRGVEAPAGDAELQAVQTAMLKAYEDDANAISAKKTELNGYATAETTLFGAANQVFVDDGQTITDLTNRYNTYTEATTAYNTALGVQSAKGTEYTEDTKLQTAAQSVYNAPILETIDTHANAAISTSIASGEIKDALDAKVDMSYAEGVFAEKQAWVDNTLGIESANADAVKTALTGTIAGESETFTGAINAIDTAVATNAENIATTKTAIETNAGNIATNKAAIETNAAAIAQEKQDRIDNDALTLRSAKSYTDKQTLSLQSAMEQTTADIRSEFAAADARTLASANAYTNSKVNALEKNVSGGVAAATALSAVSVGDVKRGEVSVGGGYGYYNSQSAMAFGAAMGLSDGWSINAGAGLASGDKTQFSIRAGTNYKFKLF